MNGIYLLLGSNLGDRLKQLKEAVNGLKKQDVHVLRSSSVYETAPYGVKDQPNFLNAVIEVKTQASPEDLLYICLQVEHDLGRIRQEKWGTRLIDIDILYYYNLILESDELSIPHPGIPDRRFTLLPLVELSPEQTDPKTGQSLQYLLTSTKDSLPCHKTNLDLNV